MINRDKFTHLRGLPSASSNEDVRPDSVRTQSGRVRDVTQQAFSNYEVQIEIAESIVEDMRLAGLLPGPLVWLPDAEGSWLSERCEYEPALFLTTAMSGDCYVASPAHLGQYGIDMHLHCLRLAARAMQYARQGAARLRARYDS